MKKIPVGSSNFALVDDADYDWLNQYMWHINGGGYIQNDTKLSILSGICCSPISLMSRLILGLRLGDKREADHINHNLLDNQRDNLRGCTRSQNQMNKKASSNKSSQFKGVSWSKWQKRWRVQITMDGKKIWVGFFENEKHAAHAYNLMAKKYFGKFAFLNKIA